jgi:putative Mg2+ transporter-C (MgtC) family protein
MEWMNDLRIIGEVALAALLGGVLGLERELARKPAGLRTQMFVAAGAALMVALGRIMVIDLMRALPSGTIQSDPLRILGAIITGVSFIGAGMIVFHKEENRLEGLTTAAATLMVAGIGIAVALHEIPLAIGLTVMTLLITLGLGVIERRLPKPPADEVAGQEPKRSTDR